MKKLVLFAGVAIGLAATQPAQAQMGPLVNLIGAGLGFGASRLLAPKLTPAQKAAQQATPEQLAAAQAAAERDAAGPAAPQELVRYRTPADKVPKQAAEQLAALETQLDRCHAALLADANAAVCTPEQRAAIQQAALGVARAKPGFDLHPYQQEMAFYLAENERRQQAAAPLAK